VIDYLKTWHPALHDFLALLTVIHLPTELALKQIPELVKDPLKALRAEYLQSNELISAEDADAFTDKLFPRLAALLADFGYHSEYVSKATSAVNFAEVKPFLHSFWGRVIWAETFSLFTCVLTPQATPVCAYSTQN